MAQVTIKLYGNISDWNANSANEMVCRLDQAAKEGDTVVMRVHSYGGSVIEGNMIYNAIKKCKKPVHAYVDGVAASMASIVITAADKVFMAENAFIMIHAPAGTASRGTLKDHATTVKLLTAMEKTFITALVSRTGKAEAIVAKWLDGDTWFSAAEALAAGLIDGIVDPIAKNIDALPLESDTIRSVEAIYDRYTAELEPREDINQHKSNMNKELLIKTLGLTGVTAQSTDEQIESAIIANHNADQVTIKTAADQVKAQTATQITAALDQIKGHITVEQRAELQTIGETCGIKTLQAAIQPIIAHKPITEMIQKGASAQGAGNGAWDFDAWQKNDPSGLEKLSKDNYDAFNALYKAKFGTEAPK